MTALLPPRIKTVIRTLTLTWLAFWSLAGRAALDRRTLVVVPGVGMAPPAAINGFNPLLISSVFDEQAANLMYAPLLWINRHLQIDYALSVARAVTIGPHDTSYTIRLKRHWFWSDGTPVTARDVAYTYHLIRRLKHRFPNYGTGGIPTEVASFTVINPYTIRIVTRRPVNPRWFELNGLSLLVPLPAQDWHNASIPTLYDTMTDVAFFQTVDGPFHLQSFRPGRYATFTANKAYSGPDKSYFQRLVFRFLQSPESVFFALRAGRLDIGNLPMSLYQGRRQLTEFRAYTVGPVWGFNYLGFNYANPRIAFVRNVRVRQAIMHALSQHLLIQVLYHGHGLRDYGPIPVSPARFLSRKAEALDKHGAYDPRLARHLLRAAGWHRGPHGIRRKNGRLLAFTLTIPPGDVRGPVLIKDMLAQVGIDMRLREQPFNEMVAETEDPHNTQWQAIALAWGLSPYPSAGNIFACGAANNDYHYCNPTLDKRLRALTRPGNLTGLHRYENYFASRQPVIVLPEFPIIVEAARGLKGLHRAFSPLGGFNPEFLWRGDPYTPKTPRTTPPKARR